MSTFGFETEGNDLVSRFANQVKDRTFLITGPSQGGIGAETVISLAHGHPDTLILLGRSLTRIQPTIEAVKAIDGAIKTKFFEIDLASLASVRAAAKQILDDESIPKIDVVINNAAVMACPYTKSVDGIELQLAANHLGHFLLTNLLVPKILAAAGGPAGARIVNVSSSGTLAGGIRWDDPNFEEADSYTEFGGYGQSKTANVQFAIGLNDRLAAKGVRAYALHPGSIATGLQKHMTPELGQKIVKQLWGEEAKFPIRKTLQQGCSTTLRAALDPDLPSHDDVWLEDCQLSDKGPSLASWAVDRSTATKTWEWSENLVGQKFAF